MQHVWYFKILIRDDLWIRVFGANRCKCVRFLQPGEGASGPAGWDRHGVAGPGLVAAIALQQASYAPALPCVLAYPLVLPGILGIGIDFLRSISEVFPQDAFMSTRRLRTQLLAGERRSHHAMP